MKKITIILLIILVLGIMAGVLYFAYSSGDLTYVCDYRETKNSSYSSSMVAKRLYSSNIDESKMEELSSSLLTTAFTEDELLAAALKSGKPEFYPWFSFQAKKKAEDTQLFLEGKFGQTLFENQTTSRFTLTNVKMEMTVENAVINSDSSIVYGSENFSGEMQRITPVIAEDGSSLAVQLGNAGAYNIVFEGTSGTIMVQYTYDIIPTDGLFKRLVLEDQLIQIYITITTAADGTLTANYEITDASQISDLY